MQRLVELDRRMHAIEDIRSVARTMATVASAKLSRTRARAVGMRAYSNRLQEVLERQEDYLAAQGVSPSLVSPYFVTREPPRKLTLLHLCGDRGMCGNYNVAVDRLAREALEEWEADGVPVEVVVRGQKGAAYLRRRTRANIVDEAGWPRGGVTGGLVEETHALMVEAFIDGGSDEIWAAYTRFHTPVRREPRLERLLPIRALDPAPADSAATAPRRWSYEPRPGSIIGALADLYVRVRIEDVLLESYASEQGARMITMEEATERAGKLLHECRVLYNRLRREFITTDLLSVLFASRTRRERLAGRS